MPAFPVIGRVDCIVMEGADVHRFAQAQFSGDVNALVPQRWQWNAWLTAQGRVRALMQLVGMDDGRLVMLLRGGNASAIRDELAHYLLRTKASLSLATFTARAGEPLDSGTAQFDGSAMVLGLGSRSLRLEPAHDEACVDAAALTAWRLADIRAGWSNLPADGEPRFLPPALALERLGAIAYDKGCYPGQEIAARLHYRGGHKHQLCHLRSNALLPVGDIRRPDGTRLATVMDAVTCPDGYEALAVIPNNISSTISMLGHEFNILLKFAP